MSYPIRKISRAATKNTLRPGEYESIVVSLTDADGYVPGNAFTLTYELQRDDSVFLFRETYINDLGDPRTAELLNYLADNGITLENIDVFVGCHEKVTLLKEVKLGRGTFLNIVDRHFV